MKSKREYLARKRRAACEAWAVAADRHRPSHQLRRGYILATADLLKAELLAAKPKTCPQPEASPDLFNF